ncbi:MAG: enoyl-ACP reductase [Armatimonadetes bacterium]|nr:enoyl-ACP reductase [Armatimonadota bacterium]
MTDTNKPLAGKTGLIFGVANKRSIAWAIAQAWHEAGARLIFNYQGERLKENVEELASTFGEEVALAPCDVSRDEELDSFFSFVKTKTDTVDLVLHSVAFAPRDALSNPFSHTTREQFRIALDVSTYSLISMAQYAAPMMTGGGSIVAMTYLGSEKVLPNYNVMGVAKAGLECSARYLAHELGPQGIRVNCISAGPTKTLAGSGIAGFSKMVSHVQEKAPLAWPAQASALGGTGLYLATDASQFVTGQVVYVDGGYQIMGM